MALKKKTAPAVESAAEPAVEKAAAKEAAPKKASPAKSVLKKPAAKKTTGKVEEVYLQAGGAEWKVSDCSARAIAAYVAEGNRESSVKKLVVYLKPEEGKAYYVINDNVNGSIDL